MIELRAPRRRHVSFDETNEFRLHPHPQFSHGTSLWVGVAAIAVGAAGTLYGANAQKKANQAAINANQSAQDKQNNAAWNNWLMTKGIQPTSPVVAGEVPQAGSYSAVNTRLPLWANVTYGTSVAGQPATAGMRLVKKGTATRTGITGFAPVPAAVAPEAEATPDTVSGGSSTKSKVGKALLGGLLTGDPLLGAVVGNNSNTVKKVLDPFHIFCWAAREAYGEKNQKWLQFQEWMLAKAPVELRELYGRNAPTLAEAMRHSPELKSVVRDIMDLILANPA